MKKITALLPLLGLLFSGAVATQVHGQTADRRTKVTFNQPVAVPGKALPAGSYTFTILHSLHSRNIVQIWNEDKTQLITTIIAIPNYRLERTDETVINFSERPAGRPQAVKAWFYPGDKHGIEFVYPKQEAVELAKVANEIVPAEAVEPTPSTLETVPLIAVTPKGEEEPIAQAFPAAPEEPKTVAKVLPRTASPLPLIAFLGGASILFGLAIRRFAQKMQ